MSALSVPPQAAPPAGPAPGARLRFLDDGTVEVRSGKVELGQGILTAFTQIAAEALGLPPQRVRMLPADTLHGPDEGVTSGSLSVQEAGAALRRACVVARGAAGRGAPDNAATAVVGQSLARLDLPAKLRGQPSFIHDLAPAGLLHGRVLRPPRTVDAAAVARTDARASTMPIDEASLDAALALVRLQPGVVAVRRDGQLLGVLAESRAQLEHALARLSAACVAAGADAAGDPADASRATSTVDARLPSPADDIGAVAMHEHSPGPRQRIDERGTRPGSTAAPAAAHAPAPAVARTLQARYSKPWIAHASIGPSCALACWLDAAKAQAEGGRLQVWTHSQGIFNLRRDLALAFALDASDVRVRHAEGAGCYGHNGADDVAWDAAWLAQAVPGRPVRVLWSRADDFTQAPLGPAMAVELAADLDAEGDVVHWRHAVVSPGHSSRPGRSATPALLGSWQTAQPFEPPAALNVPLAAGGGAERNAVPGYALPAWQIDSLSIPRPPLRPSALRSLGAFANVFAIESFVDEIAHATGVDPLAWRRRHLAHDARALAVLEAAAARAGWAQRTRAEGVGHGLGMARYKGQGAWCAVVAEVEAAAALRVRRLWIAVDVGQAVNPDGVVAQIEGGAIQATSWTLKEAVQVEAGRVFNDRWSRYPILRFSDVPALEVQIVPSDQPSLGAGEAALGPTAAAIANALFDALGVRVRDLPLTPERIVAAIAASA